MGVNFWEEEIMGSKKEVLHSFKACEPFSIWLASGISVLDCSKSELIRCCILMALPSVIANPSLLQHVRFEDILDKGCGK